MLDKDKIILVCYIDVSKIDNSYMLEYLNSFNAPVTHKSFNSVIDRFFNNIPLDSKLEVEKLVR